MIVGVILFCCGGGVVIALANNDNGKFTATTKTSTRPEPAETVTVTVTVTETVTVTASPPAPSAPPGPKTTINGDGTYLVGVDIQPGQYRTTVPSNSVGCYWERRSDTTGQFEGIIANNNESAGAQVVVTIAPADRAFVSNRCGTWEKIG